MRTTFKHIAELLTTRLGTGFYMEDLLPSERELAIEFSVSRPTIRRALNQLLADGLLQRREHGRLAGAHPKLLAGFFFPAMVSRDNAAQYEMLKLCAEEFNVRIRPIFYASWHDPSLTEGIAASEAIIVIPQQIPPNWMIQKLRQCGKPVLMLECDLSEYGLLSFDLFPKANVERLLQYLLDQGFRDMNLLNISHNDIVVNQRRAMWQGWLNRHNGNGRFFEFLVPNRVQESDELRLLFRESIVSGAFPLDKLVLCATFPAAQLLVRAAADVGLVAGQDYSVACIDGEMQAAISYPSITAIERANARMFYQRFFQYMVSGKVWSGSLYEANPEIILIKGESIIRDNTSKGVIHKTSAVTQFV